MTEMSELRLMIGEVAWQKLSGKYPHLESVLYVVKCETCGKVFFETQANTVQEMLHSGAWIPSAPQQSQLWYIAAARHWIPQKFHSIRVHLVAPDGDRTLIMDLTADWKRQIPEQKAMIRKGYGFDRALRNELDSLEKEITAKMQEERKKFLQKKS